MADEKQNNEAQLPDLTDLDEVRKAIIAAEILNKKYKWINNFLKPLGWLRGSSILRTRANVVHMDVRARASRSTTQAQSAQSCEW